MNNEDLISDLDALLAVTSTHEFRAMAIDAAKFIYETQVEEFAIRLQNAISDSEDLDNSEIVANIALALRESMDDFLLDHRIRLNDEARLSMVAKVCRAVLELPFWEEVESVVDICMQDSPPEDKLADLVKLVSGGETQTIAYYIENADETFFERLIKIVNKEVVDLDETELETEQVTQLKLFKQLFGKTFALQMVELGWRIGSPVGSYFSRAQTRLVQLNNQDMAKEIVAFLLMGSDTWFDPLSGWSNQSASLQLELNTHAVVTVEIRKILQQIKGPDYPMRSIVG